MCASKWALKNILRQSILTKCLSWPSKNKFHANFLQTLLIWDSHFNSSSSVTPRTLYSRTCSIRFAPRVSLSIRGLRWCFCLEANTMLFVFPGWITMLFLWHHFDTSFKPSWREHWIDPTSVPHEWIEWERERERGREEESDRHTQRGRRNSDKIRHWHHVDFAGRRNSVRSLFPLSWPWWKWLSSNEWCTASE